MDSLETIYEADSSLEASVIENLLKTSNIACETRKSGGSDQFMVLVNPSDKAKAEQAILDYHDTSED